MMKLPHMAGLEGLLDLNRRGIDIRPTLLRVVTDQYLLSQTHTPDEERQFTELALRLLGETDIATRTTVAMRLASYPSAPRPIIQKLARDVLEVAAPILRHSPLLTPTDLATIADERGPSYAAIMARRSQAIDAPPPGRQLTPTPAPPAVAPAAPPAPAANAAAALIAPPADQRTAAQTNASQLCEIFFSAQPAERRLILICLDYLDTPTTGLPSATQRADIWRLESAALQHNTEAVVREFERMLGISRRQARRIVGDERGEPTVVAGKALELPADVLQRMLLFMNPRVGRSVDRVYKLASLYEEISVDAAHRLIALWRAADPAHAPTAKHEALWQDAVEHARQALADITRRAPARRDPAVERPIQHPARTERR